MNIKQVLALCSAAVALAACDSGDITLSPTTVDNSTSTGGGGGAPVATNPCASYSEAGQTFQGEIDANGNCFYDSLFVSDTRPITVSAITFPALDPGMFHVFEDSLYIGEDVDANAAQTGKRIPQEGEGTRLTIAAGSTMVFTKEDAYVRVARGSQIFAEGTEAEPITFTAIGDAILGTATESDRGLWGGVQINGNGRTNKCHDGTPTGSGAGAVSDFAPLTDANGNVINVHNCHVGAEGRPATYGGNNNNENSGVLTYVVIKHAGFEVVDGNELNALTLNGVGSGTTINHVQTYTTQDDGFEMFGGAVNMDHIVAVNVGDDSIDYSQGYNGKIQFAVVVHTSGGGRCIEGDNTGGNAADNITPTTLLRISNLTCITSNVDENQGTNPSSKDDSEGPLFREGVFFEMYNSIVTSNEPTMTANECLELHDTEGPETIDAAQAGISIASSNLIACQPEATKETFEGSQNNVGFDTAIWLAGGDGSAQIPVNGNTNNVVVDTNLPMAMLIDGGVGTRGYRTLDMIQDSTGAVVFDQATQLTPLSVIDPGVDPDESFFDEPTHLGGVSSSGTDWLANWTVGLTEPLVP